MIAARQQLLARAALMVLAVLGLGGCATGSDEMPQSPEAQVIRAYGMIEAAALTVRDLERAGIMQKDEAGRVRTRLREHYAAVTTFRVAVASGAAPPADVQAAFASALRALVVLRGELATRSPK